MKKLTSQSKKLVKSLVYIHKHFVPLVIHRRLCAGKHLPDKEDLINTIWKRCVILFVMFKQKKYRDTILFILESVQKNKWMTFLDKLSIYNQKTSNILHIELFQILVQELISQEKACKQFWTPVYKELSEKLLLPTEIDYPDLVSNLSNVSLQKPVVKSQYSMMTNTKVQNKNLQKTYYQLSTSTVVNKWEKEVTKQIELKSLKIKIKPTFHQKKILDEWIKTSNYVYNKGIACINNGDKINFNNLRDKCVTNKTKKTDNNYSLLTSNIKLLNVHIKNNKNEHILKLLQNALKINKLKHKNIKFEKNLFIQEWETKTPKEIRAEAIRDFCKAYKTSFENLKAGNIHYFKLGFRKITKSKKSLSLPHSLITNNNGTLKISPNFMEEHSLFKMGKRTLKKHKNIEIKHDCRLVHHRNEYWIHIPIPTQQLNKKTPINYCGIDPGVRTFLTTFGNNEVNEYNQNKSLLNKLNKKIDILNSNRIRKKHKFKIEKRKEHIINELHWKSINDIFKRNDYVFYGDIKSHDIVKKSNNKFLNRDINNLKFYKFKERLIYKANIYNKQLYKVNEHYTTMTCSSCGNLNNVGKQEIYKCQSVTCKKTLLRDVSAAKNILMKGIMQYLS